VYSNASPRRITSFKVSYPTLPSIGDTLPNPEAINLIEKQYSHDVMVLHYALPNYNAIKTLKTGVPVSFTWSKSGQERTWIGYVSFVSSESSGSVSKQMSVHCIGSSFPMKERSAKTFSNKTIPQVAEQLAKEHGLKFIGDPHPRKFKTLQVSGQSHWEWLIEQAKRIGYGVVVDGTNLHFRTIDSLMSAFGSDSAVMSFFAKDFPTDTLYYDRTLDYFKVLNGEYVESGELRNNKLVGGVDPVTGKVVSAASSAKNAKRQTKQHVNDIFFSDHKTNQVVHDITDAKTSSEGAAQLSRFNTPASVKGQGDPRMRPFSTVYIDGISDETDGRWLITEIVHIITLSGEYQVEMKVATDGYGKQLSLNSANTPVGADGIAKGQTVRITDNSVVGTVNLQEALARKGKTNKSLNSKTFKLKQKHVVAKESNQGFNRTPTVWAVQPKTSQRKTR
jgi:phage protein D